MDDQPSTGSPVQLLVIGQAQGLGTELHRLLEGTPYDISIQCRSGPADAGVVPDHDLVVLCSPPHDAAVSLGFLEHMRQSRPDTPVILVVPAPDRTLSVRALQAGAHAILSLPLESDYVMATLKQAILMRQLYRQVEAHKMALQRQAAELEAQVQARTAELARKDREQQIIFNSVPAMIWYKDARNRILRANQAAATSLGLRVEEVEGRSTYDLYPEEADKYHKDDLEVILTGKPKVGIIEPYQTGAGSKRWVRTDKIPYRNESGQVVGVIVFALDITDCLDRFARQLGSRGTRRSLVQGQA